MARLRVGLCACESSGDQLGVHLIESMRKRHPDIEFTGVAGPGMLAAGCVAIASIEQLSVMGLAEVLGRLPSLWRLRRKITEYFLNHPPDIFIGIDGPDFNFPIEQKLKRSGILVAHYVSPSIWAWRQYRIRKISSSIDLMLTLFPFENKVYEEHGIPVTYTGHPLLLNHSSVSKASARDKLGFEASVRWVALLPGSRKSEVRYLLPLFLSAARYCQQSDAHLRYVMPVANGLDKKWIEQLVSKASVKDIHLVSSEQAQLAMSASDAALVASGTATFECLLAGTPMVVAYVLHPVTYQILKRMVRVDVISLPNHLARHKVVPELIQAEATPEKLSETLMSLLNDKRRANQQIDGFNHIVAGLKNSQHLTEASNAILQLIEQSKSTHDQLR